VKKTSLPSTGEKGEGEGSRRKRTREQGEKRTLFNYQEKRGGTFYPMEELVAKEIRRKEEEPSPVRVSEW